MNADTSTFFIIISHNNFRCGLFKHVDISWHILFINLATDIIDAKYDDVLIENYLKQIIRHHCIKNSISYSGINQKVINKYLVVNPDKKKVSQLRLGKRNK